MEFSSNLSSFAKEYSEIIRGVLDLKGIIPITETVTDITNEKEYTIEKNIFNICSSVLSAIPAICDLTTLTKKLCITVDSEHEGAKKMGALKKAEIMASLFNISNGKVKTGATGFSSNHQNSKLNYIKNDIKIISLSKEIIVKDPKIVGECIDEEVPCLRICTDGKPTRLFNKHEEYGDLYHKDFTACFGKAISADRIPYIVTPLGEEHKKFNFSVGAIIDRHGNYLHCVVAERGPQTNGLGEVSIYAAWKMNQLPVPPKEEKDGTLNKKYTIGDEDQYQYIDENNKDPKYSIPWRIVIFQKSAPGTNSINKYGWHYDIPEAFRIHIYRVGKKYYQGTGKCLYTKENLERDKKVLKRKRKLKKKKNLKKQQSLIKQQNLKKQQNIKKQNIKKQKLKGNIRTFK